jgi:hypothetical protein
MLTLASWPPPRNRLLCSRTPSSPLHDLLRTTASTSESRQRTAPRNQS